ncbi:LemA family protein [Faecalibacterium sp. An77]|uniref:LemA family protein n=1 Tax=Faecalibacterium sp. An77 TaxID=1965655 RepID=UPI001FA87B0C|nr:LemA family protein [Faecalibacterium sp. An77]
MSMQILIIVAAVVVALAAWYISLYNRLRRLSVKVQEGSSGIDVALEKRYDMLSEELEAVKKFLQHEYDVYTGITAVRTGKELEEAAFEEKKGLSKEAAQTIQKTINEQQLQMQEIKKQMEQRRVQNSPDEDGGVSSGDSLSAQQMSLNQKLGLLTSVQQGLSGVSSSINALAEQYPVLFSIRSVEHFQRDIFDAEEHLQAARRLYNANVSLYNQRIEMFPYLIVAKLHGMKKADFYEVEEKKKTFEVKF